MREFQAKQETQPDSQEFISSESEKFLKQTGLTILVDDQTLVFWRRSLRTLLDELTQKNIPFQIFQVVAQNKEMVLTTDLSISDQENNNTQAATVPFSSLTAQQEYRTVFMFSPCITSEWGNGSIEKSLMDLAHTKHLAIIQTLPSYNWQHTHLGNHSPGWLSPPENFKGNLVTGQLIYEKTSPFGEEPKEPTIPMPVLEFVKDHITKCIQTFDNKAGASIHGYQFYLDDIEDFYEDNKQKNSSAVQEKRTLVEQVDGFYNFSSGPARLLAKALAYTHLDLDIIEEVCNTCFPEIKESHVSEIIYKIVKAVNTSNPTPAWDFKDGIRSTLLDHEKIKKLAIPEDVINTIIQINYDQLTKKFPEKKEIFDAIASLDGDRLKDVHLDQDTTQFAEIIVCYIQHNLKEDVLIPFANRLLHLVKEATKEKYLAPTEPEVDITNPYELLVQLANLNSLEFTRYTDLKRLAVFSDALLQSILHLSSSSQQHGQIIDTYANRMVGMGTRPFAIRTLLWEDEHFKYEVTLEYDNAGDRIQGTEPYTLDMTVKTQVPRRKDEVFNFHLTYNRRPGETTQAGSMHAELPDTQEHVWIRKNWGHTNYDAYIGDGLDTTSLYNAAACELIARTIKLAAGVLLERVNNVNTQNSLNPYADVDA